jgi:hypothetical protein
VFRCAHVCGTRGGAGDPIGLAWFRTKTPAAPIQVRKNIRSKETGSKNNFCGNIDFSVQFLASWGKLGIFTEKSCHRYHNVAAMGQKIPRCNIRE